MILFFDTETTGLVLSGKPATAPGQPHLVQLAAILTTLGGKELASINLIVKPDGYKIPTQASDVHGITTELAEAVGIPLRVAVACFTNLRSRASMAVAHNIDFDALVMDIALARCKAPSASPWPNRKVCTIKESTGIVKIPPTEAMKKAGRGNQFKYPNLRELHEFLFKEGFEGAHDALADVRACMRCFFELRSTYKVCL